MAIANDSVGKLVLRVVLGVTILLHGIGKILHGIDFIGQAVQAAGLPSALAYGVYVGEVVAPLMVIAGMYARIGAAIIAINMAVALFLVHASELLKLNDQGGWAIELQALMLFSAVALAFMGPGKFAFNQR